MPVVQDLLNGAMADSEKTLALGSSMNKGKPLLESYFSFLIIVEETAENRWGRWGKGGAGICVFWSP